ncbi:DUF4062 domain-containing protein [Flavobacterium cupreum]|uniref:DUF4062 domain-containing protein n=3 Tax=Flavobacterium TaxID=237 RepID=A0A434AC71_9FLAO|nr:DUF4062 domain-containing protein [Flavobacterium cupreum]RUT71972.1 DUF4062 domain-containing protein [Flavobacterium cupreum]
MANPRIFISSTCYDLSQIRDNLSEFITSCNYETVLSERGDIFYHPDLHTHECCVNEIENCNMFILVIGGRFGGNYISDPKKSITNAEYEAARVKNLPVFTFIKREVYEDHRLYQKNKDNQDIIDKIIFPSIENQKHAKKIFEFINTVRLSSVNNGFFPFEFAREIELSLKKQWAGMMFNFLNERLKQNETKIVLNTLDNLTLLNKKSEELLENILRKVNPEEGNNQIDKIDNSIKASKFYNLLFKTFKVNVEKLDFNIISDTNPEGKIWYEYVAKIDGFRISNEIYQELSFVDFDITDMEILLIYNDSVYWNVKNKSGYKDKQVKLLEETYQNIIGSNKTERLNALNLTVQDR